MGTELLTVNRYFKLEPDTSLLQELRSFVVELKKHNPKLDDYKLYDIGFRPKSEFIIIKLYFIRKNNS